VQWKNELEPPTVAQAQRDEQDAMGRPWDESMDEHGTMNKTMDEHET